MALVRPAQRVPEATVLAVAARDPQRARQFAARHGTPPPNDSRWGKDLAGGALMGPGCYTVSVLRHLAGAEPEVVSAQGWWTRGGVDRAMEARLRFSDGRTARLTCSLFSAWLLRASAV